MARHPDLERILQAWYDRETCEPSEKKKLRHEFDRLLDQTRAATHLTRDELILVLRDRYWAFRKAKEKELAARVSRLK